MIKKIYLNRYFGFILIISALGINLLEYVIDIAIGDGDGKISSQKFEKAHTFYFFIAVSFGIYLLVKRMFPLKTEEFVSKEITSEGIYLFRVLYGIVAFSLAAQNHEPLMFLYDDFDSAKLNLLYTLNHVWLLNSILIIFGFGGRIPYVLNFLLLPSLLHGDVGREQLKVIGFWMIFMNLHGNYSLDKLLWKKKKIRILKPNEISIYWPVFMAVANLSLTVTQAGISKAMDPFWLDGTGYYYTFLNHWLKQSTIFDFMLNNKTIMLILNYGTLVTEILTLPLILFKPLRIYGVIILFLMFLMLTFIFRIDPIGPSGLLCAFLSIFTLPKFHRKKQIHKVDQSLIFNKVALNLSSTILIIQLVLNIHLEYRMGRFSYPMLNYPFSSSLQYRHSTVFDKQLMAMESIYGFNPRYKLNIAWYTVFNFHNFFGRGIYKIVADAGKEKVDISGVFNEDGTTNIFGAGGGILRPRVIQDRLTYIHYTAKKIAYRGIESVANNEKRLIEEILNFFVSKSNKKDSISAATLYVKTLRMPKTFEKNFNSMSADWEPLCFYNVNTKEITYAKNISKLDFSHIHNPFFSGKYITYQP